MTTQKVTPCEFVAGLCSNCGASERGECEGWVEPADRVQTLADQVEALTKERDALMAAAKLALAALNQSVPGEYDFAECFEAREALKQAGVK